MADQSFMGWVSRSFTHIVSGLLGGLGRTVSERFTGDWQSRDARSGEYVEDRSPLQQSAVYTAINVISSDISKLRLRILRDRENGPGREVHKNHPLMRLFRKPNHYQTSLQFLQQYMSSKLWAGNTYVYFMRDARGVPNSMHCLDPRSTTPCLLDDGSVWYHVKADKLNGLLEDIYVPARDVLHDRAVTLFHPLVGVSPLFAAAVSATVANRIAGHSSAFFKNLTRTSGVLTAPGEIPQPVADRLRAEWTENYTGPGFGSVAVLGNGLEWKPLTMTAIDAQLIEQLKWSVEDIARVFRMPAFLIGGTSPIAARNSEQLARMYFQGCLSYHIEAMEQAFHDRFELPEGVYVELDTRPLFRLETDLRFQVHTKALSSGIKSINEVRGEEDLAPVKGGEEPRLQMQYIPLSQVQAAPPITPGNPVAPAEDTDDENTDDENTDDEDKSSDDEDKSSDDSEVTEKDLEDLRVILEGIFNGSR